MLGTKKTDNGVVFRIFSENANLIELCLFSDDEKSENKIPMKRTKEGIWVAEVANIKEGQKYGYRAHGTYNYDQCLFFKPCKLLVDPYAKEISDTMQNWDNPALLLEANEDTAHLVPKAIVCFDKDNSAYPYLNKKPNHALDDTIIYELNVKGFSAQNKNIPKEDRGTFRALAHKESIAHLKSLNITEVELMPIMPTCGGFHLKQEKGLSDYWGYNPYNHFAVDPKFGTLKDFKLMVNELHKHDISVCMDVVYNHTSPNSVISYEGLDALSYHRIVDENGQKKRLNSTGCHNSFNTAKKPALDVFYNSIKYFSSIGVDSFRLDLAADCAMNENNEFDENSPFMQAILKLKDELGVKFYGEPWNAVGIQAQDKMSNHIIEWDDAIKKTAHKALRAQDNIMPELAYVLAGAKKPKVKYLFNHDTAPLYDFVEYFEKNNYANNENNQDGNNDKGLAIKNKILKKRVEKTALSLVALARGIPLINGGDEILRTQLGNNNAYCQDNELSWHNWSEMNEEKKEMYLFSRKLLYLRKSVDVFSSAKAMNGNDVEWFMPNAENTSENDWKHGNKKTLAYKLKAQKGKQDYIVIISCNPDGDVEYKLPKSSNGKKWSVVFDTADKNAREITSINKYSVKPFGLVVLTSSGENLKENVQIMLYDKNKQR